MKLIGQKKTNRRRRGFTLLEVVIALGLMGLLVGMIFRVARSSMQLSQIVVEEQNATMERNAFFNLLKNQFEQMPGNAVLRLESRDSRNGDVSRTLFTLTLQNVPMSFNWGETPMTAEAVELATVEQRDGFDGFVDVVLRFYDEEILRDSNLAGNDDPEPVAEITLLEDLWMCDCVVVDGSGTEDLAKWDDNGRLPLLVKFYCRFDSESDIVQQTFWIVPKQNPEVVMRQIIQQNPAGPQAAPGAGGGNTNPDGGGTPGTGGTGPTIEIKPGGSTGLPGDRRK